MKPQVSTVFFVDRIKPCDGGICVLGKVYEGTVRLGQIFDYAYGSNQADTSAEAGNSSTENDRQICLEVSRIEAYRRATDLLESGTSGVLYLSGLGTDHIKSKDVIVVSVNTALSGEAVSVIKSSQ